MKINKILSIFLIIALALSVAGCKDDDDDYVVIEDGGGDDEEKTEEQSTTYVYKSKTLHRENCYYARAIQEHEKKVWDKDVSVLLDDGYKFCGLCCPDEKMQYAEPEGEPSGVDPSEATYVLNIGQKKFHNLGCRFVEGMSPSNTEYTDLERDVIIESGYAPCQECEP